MRGEYQHSVFFLKGLPELPPRTRRIRGSGFGCLLAFSCFSEGFLGLLGFTCFGIKLGLQGVGGFFLFSLARVSQVRAYFFQTATSPAGSSAGSGSPSSSLPLSLLSSGVSLSRSWACGAAVSAWAASVVPPPAGMSGVMVRTQGGIDNALAGIFCVLSVFVWV